MGTAVTFRLESDLKKPIADWLSTDGFDVHFECEILGRRADLVGHRAGCVAAVEAKLRDWREAFRQALAYQLAADRAWVAMPLDAAARAYRQRWRFEAEAVGLLAVDDSSRIRVLVAAQRSPRLLDFARSGLLAEGLCGGPNGIVFSKRQTDLEAF